MIHGVSFTRQLALQIRSKLPTISLFAARFHKSPAKQKPLVMMNLCYPDTCIVLNVYSFKSNQI